MKKAILFVLFILFSASAFAYDLNSGCDLNSSDFNAIGSCIIKGSFSGDLTFFAIIMLLLFAIFAWQARLPMGAALGIGLILSFAFMGVGMNLDQAQLILNLIILIIGALVGLAILHFVRR